MISGAHAIIYSKKPEADRAFLRNVLAFSGIDVGGGWLIFGLPPSEIAVHPSKKNDVHELFLICDDVTEFVGAMKRRRVRCTPIADLGWGLLTKITLPGGGKLGVYEPRHARPKPMQVKRARSAKRSTKRAVRSLIGRRAPAPRRQVGHDVRRIAATTLGKRS